MAPPNVTIGRATVDRTPTVTFGHATRTGVPSVSIGRAYGESDTGSGAFEITEITGPDQRTVRLTANALPYKPIEFGIRHSIEESKYPGSPTKSQQALGGEFLDTEIKGCWKTRFIGDPDERMVEVIGSRSEVIDGIEGISIDNTRVTSAAELVAVFEDIALKGQVLRVSWLHHSRIGRIEEFVPTWLTAHDCEWRIKFKWIGRDENAPAPTPSQAGLLEMSAQCSKGFVDLYDATEFDDVSDLEPSMADRIDSGIGRLKRGIEDLEAAIEQRAASATRPIESMRRAMEISTYLADQAQTFIDDMDAISAPALSVLDDPVAALSMPAGLAIRNACAMRRAVLASRILKHRAARVRFAALQRVEGNAIAVVLFRDGEDMATLSRRYYGTPDDGDRIRLYNGLDTNTPPAGTVIIVPAAEGP